LGQDTAGATCPADRPATILPFARTSADREIQRTLMELLNQMDGFDVLGKVKMIMATNRPDTLDPALLRPGRLDRKIEISLPNEQSRLEILKIHASKLAKVRKQPPKRMVPPR